MTQDLISALQAKEAKGTSVMGMGMIDTGYIFSGNVLDVIQSNDGKPEILLIEGAMFDGNMNIPFRQDMPIEMLKVFNQDVFKNAYKLMESSEAAIRKAVNLKERCKQLMT